MLIEMRNFTPVALDPGKNVNGSGAKRGDASMSLNLISI